MKVLKCVVIGLFFAVLVVVFCSQYSLAEETQNGGRTDYAMLDSNVIDSGVLVAQLDGERKYKLYKRPHHKRHMKRHHNKRRHHMDRRQHSGGNRYHYQKGSGKRSYQKEDSTDNSSGTRQGRSGRSGRTRSEQTNETPIVETPTVETPAVVE
ncbi:MAG: hypothetical protein LBV65_04725 [Desulfovibrio sp.]|jgi:hypothetical protein|nr:hypothetical protein [Desulfovibrio sp.]